MAQKVSKHLDYSCNFQKIAQSGHTAYLLWETSAEEEVVETSLSTQTRC